MSAVPVHGNKHLVATGENEEEEEEDANKVQANGLSGQFGVLAANWGGKWSVKKEDDYMNDDIEASVCQMIALQEVELGFLVEDAKPRGEEE